MAELGPEAAVRVAVATLWTAPERVRPVDAPALGVPADVRGWVGAMSDAHRDDLDGRTLSQLLLGERVLVTDVRDGWARVIATEQPAPKLDPRGYPGWLPAAQLAPILADASHPGTAGPDAGGPDAGGPDAGGPDAGGPDGAAPYLVRATATSLRDEPDGDVVLAGVLMGTRLVAAGPPEQGWLPVRVTGHDEPLWARWPDLTAAPGTAADPAEIVRTAEHLLDVAYVWGGLSAYGVDCSGLVYLAWRRHGVLLPRDADEQAAATVPVPLGTERPGDLYFFARPGRGVHHVGVVAARPDPDGTRWMVHACGTKRRVVHEAVTGERADTLTAAHRVIHAPGGGYPA